MITVFNIRTKIIYFKNICKFCENGLIFTWFLAQTNVQADRQKYFKLSHGKTITNSITMKTRLFQQKIIYGNWSTRSKVMAEQKFKNNFMWPCKKYLSHNHDSRQGRRIPYAKACIAGGRWILGGAKFREIVWWG